MIEQITLQGGATVYADVNQSPSHCKQCDDEIYWAETLSHKKMPIKLDEVTNEYFSHFVDCPFADKFRRKK